LKTAVENKHRFIFKQYYTRKTHKNLCGCSSEKPIWMLATNSYTFIPHTASYYMMVGFLSLPPGDI